MKELETLKLYRGATSVIELDFTGFNFESNSYCQLTIKKKYNDDIVFQHDFKKPIKYYVTFKDEFTVGLDDNDYKYDIMYMLNEERYPQCSISDIVIDGVVNSYEGEFDTDAVHVTEVLTEGAEITQTIKVTTSNVIIASSNLQVRTVTPTKEDQVVLADDGFDGMSKVVVKSIPSDYIIPNLQEKEARVTAPTNIFVHPDEEYDGLSFVNVIASVDTETKEVTPSKEVQTINRSDGKYIDSVTVNAIPDNYIEPSGELEITENGSYDVTDKASVKVETSGADLSEYFNINPSETTTGNYNTSWIENNYILKLPDITLQQENSDCTSMFKSWKLPILPKITNTQNIQSAYAMFGGCQTKQYDVSEWNTSNITKMTDMFSSCYIETLDLSKWNVDKVTDMQNMFYSCKAKSIIAPNLVTNKITSLPDFENASLLETLDISNWDTSNVTVFASLFYSCTKLTTIDVSSFNTSKGYNFESMFRGCSKLSNLDLSNFDMSNATSIPRMFYSCASLVDLDLSNFDLSKVSYCSELFSCANLTNLQFAYNLGKGYKQKTSNYSNYKLDLSKSTLLTHDSLMSVINNLYDLNLTYDVANGGTLYTQQLVLGADNLAKLSEEELAVATSKGWTVS